MRYVRLAMYEPDIVEYDAPVPGVRMTATEARVYARRLIELADELAAADAPPAQPVAEWRDISGNDHALSQADAEHQPVLVSTPPAQPDDERVRAIRERLARITPGEWVVNRKEQDEIGVYDWLNGFEILATTCSYPDEKYDEANADFIAGAPADIRYLLTRLDAVQAERDALLRHAISMASALDMEGLDDNDAVRYVKRLMTKESDDANA